MKAAFPGYYRPTDDEFTQLWDDCTFAPDANVLLNMYRYTSQTRDALVSVLKELSARLWVPHQAAREYQERRLGVIASKIRAFDDVLKDLASVRKTLLEPDTGHPLVPSNRISRIEQLFTKLQGEINDWRLECEKLLGSDTLRHVVDSLFDGRVGVPCSPEQLAEIIRTGKSRYENKQPPGYRDDADKPGDRRYGDLIIWFQLLDYAKSSGKPLVFITDDKKDDWWQKVDGRTIGPRPELVEEMLEKSNVRFHMYDTGRFLEFGQKYLKREVNESVIDEVRDVSRKQTPLFQELAQLPETMRLTRRELEVLEAVLLGETIPQIAEEYAVSKRTVDFHLARIYDKLQVTNRPGIFTWLRNLLDGADDDDETIN